MVETNNPRSPGVLLNIIKTKGFEALEEIIYNPKEFITVYNQVIKSSHIHLQKEIAQQLIHPSPYDINQTLDILLALTSDENKLARINRYQHTLYRIVIEWAQIKNKTKAYQLFENIINLHCQPNFIVPNNYAKNAICQTIGLFTPKQKHDILNRYLRDEDKSDFYQALEEFEAFLQDKAIVDSHNKNLIEKLDLRYSPYTFTKLYLVKKGYSLEELADDENPVVKNYARVQYRACQAKIERYKKQLNIKDPEFEKDAQIIREITKSFKPHFFKTIKKGIKSHVKNILSSGRP